MKKRVLSFMLSLAIAFGSISAALPVFASGAESGDTTVISSSDVPLLLHYDEEAPYGNEDVENSHLVGYPDSVTQRDDDGWERWSLPIGNGYFGANVFGRTETERIQITEKTLANPYKSQNNSLGGLNNFSETYIDIGHPFAEVTDYERTLDLKTAVSTVKYTYQGVTYTREYFTSYPDKALVIKLTASEAGALDFVLRPTVPFEQDYAKTAGDGASKHGQVTSSVENGVGTVTLTGKMGYYDIDFVGLYRVYTDGTGTVSATTTEHTYDFRSNELGETTKTDIDGTITVSGAKSAYIVVTLGSDYELSPEVFTSSESAKPTFNTTLEDAMAKVSGYLSSVEEVIADKSFDEAYETLKSRHVEDYSEIFGRVSLDLGFTDAEYAMTTDELLKTYISSNGSSGKYLEALYFQYGRYLLIASSRSGALPSNLQGTWNRYNFSPWSSGYWHNINVQMNYWHAFSTNIAETFASYAEYNAAYMEQAQKFADNMISAYNPDAYDDLYGNGWCIGTGAYPYNITGDRSSGNLGFTTQLFYEYYAYTGDKSVLADVYNVIIEAARYITKCVEEDENGNWLVSYCDSPEMYVNGVWYYTKGTTYAQTFAYLNNYNALLLAKDLGIIDSIEEADLDKLTGEHAILKTVLEQIDKYDPINVGLSGQIKEFREEDYYGSVGDQLQHRHISQLVGLYPGNLINSSTPAWIDAAKVTLENRGPGDHGWAYAHRSGLWARVGEGDKAASAIKLLLINNTATNLWDLYSPFQIDGNFGGTAAMAEMLLQSQSGYIEPLAALPSHWSSGSYTGLVARGNFEVSAKWENMLATVLNIKSNNGGECKVLYQGISGATVINAETGRSVSYETIADNRISFETEAGATYVISNFEEEIKLEKPQTLSYGREMLGSFKLGWSAVTDAVEYNVYTAVENASDYTLVGTTKDTSFEYKANEGEENARTTFAVTAVSTTGEESARAICYFNPYDLSANINDAVANEMKSGELQVAVNADGNAAKYRLYEKASGADSYVMIAESIYPILIVDKYNSGSEYAVSVVSYYGNEESELFQIYNFNSVTETVDYNPENILLGKEFVPTADAKQYEYNSTTYSYLKLTDGIMEHQNGRFSTKSNNSSAFVDATADLGGGFILDELRIYYYAGDISYAGADLTVDVYSDGTWKTVINNLQSSDFSGYRHGSGTSAGAQWLAFDMGCVKAEKIRVYSSAPVANSISYYEIECSGTRDRSVMQSVTNVFEGKTVTAGDSATAVTVGYDYSALNDGSFSASSGNRYSSKSGPATMQAVVDLEGRYALTELRLYDFTNNSYADAAFAGYSITVDVCQSGNWTTVYSVTTEEGVLALRKEADSTGKQYISVNLGGTAYAEQVMITIKSTSGKYVSLYEMECSAKIVTAEQAIDITDNVLLDKEITAGESASAVHSSSFDYDNLNDDSMSNNSGRFSTKADTSAVMDAVINLTTVHALSELRIYPYLADTAYAGSEIIVSAYYNGTWSNIAKWRAGDDERVMGSGTTSGSRWISLDLSLVRAEKIRVIAKNPESGKSISINELCLSAGVVKNDPIDRAPLLEALKSLPLGRGENGNYHEFLNNENYARFKAYASELSLTKESILQYAAEIESYRKLISSAEANQFSLSFNGDIRFNFRYTVNDADAFSAFEDPYVLFIIPTKSGTEERRVYLKDITPDEEGRYIFSVDLPAAQMTDRIVCKLVYDEESDTEGREYSYSVKDYTDCIIAGEESFEAAYPGVVGMIKAMLNYGSFAQVYFGYNTDNLANEGVYTNENNPVFTTEITESAAIKTSGELKGVTLSTFTMTLLSQTTVKLYFVLDEGVNASDYTIILTRPDGSTEKLEAVLDGTRYRVDISRISPKNLDKYHNVTISDGTSEMTVSVSAMCYVSNVLSNSADDDLVNLAKALKLFNEAMKVYVGEVK